MVNISDNEEHAISRICTLHKLLVDQATELNGVFQIQMLICLLLIIVRCLTYPSIVVMVWFDPHENKLRCWYGVTIIIIDLIHVTNIFHPPSMAVVQAKNTCKILRNIANKQLVDCEKVRFFLKKLMMQELKFSLLGLVEQNDLNIILVMQYITTRLFILMTF
ncbi:uncharacterized protein [Halyomorpha halys]|uniref:uncharacterized protein n=1 Tax=Halyomorpha halys TaxID=286706 RepID=UPI0034D321A2